MVLPCEESSSGIRVDFVFSTSPYESEALSRSVPVNVGGAQVRYASVEDLIIHQLVAGRPRDLEDIRGVLLKNPIYDKTYVKRWLRDFEAMLGTSLITILEDLR
jgi:predicted nucleotidyltransferase